MAERRSLTDGLKATPAIDPEVAREFIHEGKGVDTRARSPATDAAIPTRAPLSTRIRSDFAAALKRASLERQLEGAEPHTLQDILEEAIEPWLRANGYFP